MATLERLRRHLAEHPRRAGPYAFAALALLGAAVFAVDHVLRPETFPVRQVSFEGEFRQVDERALAGAVVEVARGSFLLLDLEAVQVRARSVPWVHEVTVRRVWPDGVHVRFSEQQLVARWAAGGWVNAQGERVDLQGQPGPDGLPLLAGPDGLAPRVLAHYRQLNEVLAPVQLQVAGLTLTDRHAWTMLLDNGLVLTLGREEPEAKVARFARAWPRTLAAEAGRIRRVDLRYTNGFAVEWSSRAAVRGGAVIATGLNEG